MRETLEDSLEDSLEHSHQVRLAFSSIQLSLSCVVCAELARLVEVNRRKRWNWMAPRATLSPALATRSLPVFLVCLSSWPNVLLARPI